MTTPQQARDFVKKTAFDFTISELVKTGDTIIDRLIEQDFFKKADVVLCYASTPREVNTFRLFDEVLAAGKTLAMPKVDGDNIYFVCCQSSMELACGYRGIWEPMGTSRYVIPEGVNILCVTPGMAFDPECNRIGHGKGYYDKFFASYNPDRFFKVAPAFDFQIFEKLETQPHDIVMDCVITPSSIYFPS